MNAEKDSLKYLKKQQKYSSDNKVSIQGPKTASPALSFSQSKLFSILLRPLATPAFVSFSKLISAPRTPLPYLTSQSLVLSFFYTDTTPYSWMTMAPSNCVKQWRHVSKASFAIWKHSSDERKGHASSQLRIISLCHWFSALAAQQ